jgi:hypothetical protein
VAPHLKARGRSTRKSAKPVTPDPSPPTPSFTAPETPAEDARVQPEDTGLTDDPFGSETGSKSGRSEGMDDGVCVIGSVPMLDKAAIEAVQLWRLTFAMKKGRAVATLATAPVSFRIF